MKTTKIFYVAISLLATGMLFGCEQTPSTATTADISGNPKPNQQVQYSLADQAAYQGAQQVNDPTFCDKIENKDYQNQCKADLNDQKYLQDALTKIDSLACEPISTQDKKAACKIQVEVSLAKKKQEQEMIEANKKQNDLIQAGDYTKCKDIGISSLQDGCELNILINKGTKKTDGPLWCAKASTQSVKERCLAAYENRQ